MSPWHGKTIIGLTGNIATGKSVVRKMLEHLGAFGIDADALAHQVIRKGAPGYQSVLNAFGDWLLGPDGEIDRSKLGHVVFNDAAALKRLEAIVHPLVRQGAEYLTKNSRQPVVVIEAIKLIESPLLQVVDSVWVVTAPESAQLARLAQKRGLSEAQARERMQAQSPQEEKVSAADVVIRNDGSMEQTWQQVSAAWPKIAPQALKETSPLPSASSVPSSKSGELTVIRANPKHAEAIAALITRLSNGKRSLSRGDIMAAFGEKAFLLLMAGNKLVGVAGWQVENLVARTDELWLENSLPQVDALSLFMDKVEEASRELQAEVSLVFALPNIAHARAIWDKLGYEVKIVEDLPVSAWQEAARESMVPGAMLLFKQLRLERILHPI